MGYFENGVVFSDFAFNCGAPIGWHRSINDGYSWQPISLPTTSELANKLAYLGNGVALMPVTGLLDGSVYRTSDSGSSWSVISNGLFGFKQTIISIGVNQAAAIGNNLKNSHNLYLTTDGGITWAKKRGSFTPVDVRGVELLYIGEDVHPGIPGLYDE